MLCQKFLIASCALFFFFGAANASLVTFDVTGTDIQAGSTWTVDTATGVVPSEGLHGSANITQSGILYETDDSSFFGHFFIFQFSGEPALEIPSITTAQFVGFTGGTFTGDICEGYFCSTVDVSGLSITLTPQSASATPLPAALPLFASGLGALGLLGWRRKRKVSGAIAFQ